MSRLDTIKMAWVAGLGVAEKLAEALAEPEGDHDLRSATLGVI